MQPFGRNRHGPKIGGAVPPLFWGGGGAGSPSISVTWPTPVPSGILIHAAVWPVPPNAMWPGPRPTFMPSLILSIQPFGRNTPHQRYRVQTGQNGSIAQGEPFTNGRPKEPNAEV